MFDVHSRPSPLLRALGLGLLDYMLAVPVLVLACFTLRGGSLRKAIRNELSGKDALPPFRIVTPQQQAAAGAMGAAEMG